MEADIKTSSPDEQTRFERVWAEGQKQLPRIIKAAEKAFQSVIDVSAVLENAGGEGVFERSPVKLSGGSCISFLVVNQIMKCFERQVVPGKAEGLAVFPKILAEAQRGKSTDELARVIGSVLLPAAVYIGYGAIACGLTGNILSKVIEIKSTLDSDPGKVRQGIGHLSTLIAALQSKLSGQGTFSNRYPLYLAKLFEVENESLGGPASSESRHRE